MRGSWKQIRAIARKELRAYFGSPLALIFVGVFLAVALFVFFWAETFFARNLADLRPLFRWIPILMVFLVAALTMRQWSEEQVEGTLEILLTLPVHRANLVLGKLLAVMTLIAVALGLTFPLPVTVAILGDLDWGPVIGGYLAAALMASAYAAIGLFVSSRTDNQIVALIITVLICGGLYLVGSGNATGLAGHGPATVMRAIGVGSRFESIERGVIDLRDLAYYLSLTTGFVILNIASLDVRRWGRGPDTARHRRNIAAGVLLVGANLVVLNIWLFPLFGLRVDLTAQREYSLSQTTQEVLDTVQEPLLIRAYISERTHPLLAPLAPTIRDLLREYEIAAGGRVNAEVVDPRDDEELEAEANQVYGISPSPFQITERREATVVNSYFDVLIRYADEFVRLGFEDLIEVEPRPGGQLDVRLRNLEYDLTRSIKKAVSGFQSLDAVFASLEEPMRLTAYVTFDMLPEPLQDIPAQISKVATALESESLGNFVFQVVDPDAQSATVTRSVLADGYGLSPFPVELFSSDTYYLHMLLEIGDDTIAIYPGGDMGEADIRSAIDSAISQAVPGFLKTIGLWTPIDAPSAPDVFGQSQQPISSWGLVQEQLAQNYSLQGVNLDTGDVPGDIDVLVVIAPKRMTNMERFAIDQFLMRGGAVVLAAGTYMLTPLQLGGSLEIERVPGSLREMLSSYGVEVGTELVMDPQNEALPVRLQRLVGGLAIDDIQRLSYPFFVDIRRDGMAEDSHIASNLPALTLHWASTVTLDPEKNVDREAVTFLHSSADSWLRSSIDTRMDLEAYPELGFPVEGEQASRPLAVSIRGSFDSFFADRPSPFQAMESEAAEGGEQAERPRPRATIASSPDTSRLVVIGSSEFVDTAVLDLSRFLSADRYLLNLQLLENAVDWTVADRDLLLLRSRGSYTRLLKPLDEGEQTFWEAVNYGTALAALLAIGVVWSIRRRGEAPMELVGEASES